jgi:hypothetical protein
MGSKVGGFFSSLVKSVLPTPKDAPPARPSSASPKDTPQDTFEPAKKPPRFTKDPAAWLGQKIDGAAKSLESSVDSSRKGLVAFGKEHGGAVGQAAAESASAVIGLNEGAGLALYDMGAGVAKVATGLGHLTNPVDWVAKPQENLDRLKTAGTAVETIGKLTSPVEWALHPSENAQNTGKLLDGITEGYQQAAKDGDWSKFAGRAIVDVGSFFVGAGEANAAIKGAEGANAAAHLAEGANAASKVAEGANATSKVAEGANGTSKVADGANGTSKVADGANGTSKVADGAKVAERTGDTGRTADAADRAATAARAQEVGAGEGAVHSGGRAGVDQFAWENAGKTAAEAEQLRLDLLKANDLGKVRNALESQRGVFDKLGLSVDKAELAKVKEYLFDSKGLSFTPENYSAWKRLVGGEGSVRDAGFLAHELSEMKELQAIGGERGFDVFGKNVAPKDLDTWTRNFHDAYMEAHGKALRTEFDFFSNQLSQATNGRVRLSGPEIAASGQGPRGQEALRAMTVDGVPLKELRNFDALKGAADAIVDIGTRQREALGLPRTGNVTGREVIDALYRLGMNRP